MKIRWAVLYSEPSFLKTRKGHDILKTRRFKARVMRETALEDVCLIRELNSRSRNIARNNILFTSFRSLGKLI